MNVFRFIGACSLMMVFSVYAITNLNDHASVEALSIVNIPIDAVPKTDLFTTNIFVQIDTVFGKNGIGMDVLQIMHLKKTYLYLIFLAKLAKVQNDLKYQQYKMYFASFLKDNKSSLPHVPTAELLVSQAWHNVIVSSQDLQNSTAWQLYLKTMICDVYVYFSTVLGVIHNVEKQMFNYIPHFETSFYNDDYTQFRTLNEMARTRLVIEESLKKRWLLQCVAWSNLPRIDQIKESKKQDIVTLESEIVHFRTTTFYKTIRDAHTALGVQPDPQDNLIPNEQLLAGLKLTSPLKEQVWCYYMLYEASGQMTSFMTAQNLKKVLQICSNSELIPNIFPYVVDDYVLLDELISVQSKVNGSDQNSVHPSVQSYQVDKIIKPEYLSAPFQKFLSENNAKLAKVNQAEVQAQSFFSFFRDIGHDFSKAFDDVKHAVEAGFDAVKNLVVAAGEGIAGLGAEAVGFVAEWGGDSKISDWGDSELDKENKTFDKSLSDLSKSITDFTDSIKDGIVAPVAEVSGDLVGAILDDQKLGQDISTVIDSVSDTLSQLAATYGSTLMTGGAELYQTGFQAVEIGEQLGVVVGDAAWAIFSNKGRQAFLQQGEQLGKECVDAISQAFSTYSGLVKTGFEAVLTGLGVIINAITTIFIDLSREITYLFTGGIFNMLHLNEIPGFTLAQVSGAYATQQANHVENVLNQHRSTMNMVLGIVSCIAADAAVDIVTAGAGTGSDAAIDAAIMGAAETASDVAAQAAGQVAEAVAEQTAAETAAQAAQETLNAAKLALEKLPENVSLETRQAAQDAVEKAEIAVKNAKQVAQDAAQTAEKSSLKAKNLEKIAQDAAEKTAQRAETNAAQKAEDAKSFAQKAAEKASNYLKGQIKDIKALGESIPKAFVNLGKSNEELAEIAAKNLAEKEAVLSSLSEEGASQAEIDAAQAEINEAQKAADQAEQIAHESKLGKLKRYGKNTLKTLGTALRPVGMIMNVTFNIGSILGAANQDAKNALEVETQAKILNNLWKFNNINKISTAQQQLAYLEEMEQKTQAQIGNQALLLTVSQNSINANILNLRQGLASLFAPLYGQLLTPNPLTNLILANIGTSWTLQTDYFNLYPSQGFFTTTTGRTDFPFAQEIAQAPEITNVLLTQKKGKDKFWFNQRCSARDNKTLSGVIKKAKDPLLVQVDIQFLYTLNSEFHVGLYLGGNYHDYGAPDYISKYLQGITLAQAQSMLFGATATGNGISTVNLNTSIVDFDEAYLAKMVVLYRDSSTSALMLGVYEHEGLGWILQIPLAAEAQLDEQHTYTLQATLNKTELAVKVFVDGASQPMVDQIVQVTELQNQRTYGMICSGAAIEWNQIMPECVMKTNLRTKNAKMVSEITREQNNKVILALANTPKFGTFNLKPLSKQAILLGQYLYASTNTDLKKILPDSPIDFVIFAIDTNGQLQLGVDPQSALSNIKNARLVSVINGTVYDVAQNSVGNVANAWNQYKQTNAGPFSPKLDTFITDQQEKINVALSNVKFGESWLLTIATPTLLQNGQYLYTCMQTLKDSLGKPIIDGATKKPMIDYLVCAHYAPTSLTIGIPPTSSKANALFSFVTGNVYAKYAVVVKTAVVQPESINYQGQLYEQFGTYVGKQNLMNDPIYTLISNAQASYATYAASIVKTGVKEAQPMNVVANTKATLDHFAKDAPLIFSGSQIGYLPHAPSVKLSFGKHDLGKRQKEAAGSAGYQLYGVKKGIKLSFGKKSDNADKT